MMTENLSLKSNKTPAHRTQKFTEITSKTMTCTDAYDIGI